MDPRLTLTEGTRTGQRKGSLRPLRETQPARQDRERFRHPFGEATRHRYQARCARTRPGRGDAAGCQDLSNREERCRPCRPGAVFTSRVAHTGGDCRFVYKLVKHMEEYDAIANAYRDFKRLPFREYIERYTLFEMLGDVRGKKVLDMACGDGFYTRLLKQAGASGVTGVDVSAEMIRLAEQEELRNPLGRLHPSR